MLLQDATVNCLAAFYVQTASGDVEYLRLNHEILATTLSATTFKINAGNGSAGTTTINGEAGSRTLGGKFNSYMLVREIMA